MIKYNENTINDWYFYTSDIVKVYRNNAICYYKITSGDTPTPVQEPCFAVVDDISQYSDTEFEDVFNKADGKWYKLNNLNQYEEYGVYGSGRTITTYEGKLTVDDGYEYQYSGGSWANVGEVSGNTATLPDVSFMLNYNAKDYNASTHSIAKTSGQTKDVDAVCNYGYHIIDHSADGYISVTGNSRMILSGTTYMGRNNTETGCTITIVSKVRTTSGYSILTNRGGTSSSQMNWMWRYPTNAIFLHGSSSYNNPQYFTNTSTSPIVASVRTYYDSGVKQTLNDWTNNGSYSGNFEYGTEYNGNSALFCDYASYNREFWRGDFYWVYMSQNTLTDEQVQQVIDYNEGGGGEPEYPIYYDEIQDPPDNVSFSSMAEAEAYECPWVGMKATIDGDKYIFSGDSQSGYEWVYNPSRLPQGYTEVEYIRQNSNYNAYINTGVIIFDNTTNTYTITTRLTSEFHSNLGCATIINCEALSSPYNGLGYRYKCSSKADQLEFFGGNPNYNSSVVDNGDGTRTVTFQSTGNTSYTTNVPLSFLCSFNNSSYTSAYRFADATIYSSTIVKNGITVRDFVPAKRDNDSVYGLYDLITDTFYTSPNGNNFIGGDPV